MPERSETVEPEEQDPMQRRPARDPRRAWQPMLSGCCLNLMAPSPLDIRIEDIAHGLSRLARWNGQTRGEWAFSVAQHSVAVERIFSDLQPGMEPRWRLAALLHDAGEYVMGDLVTPYKLAVGESYKDFEARIETAVRLRFGLPPRLPDAVVRAIKRADNASAYFEATQLGGFGEREARRLFGAPPDIVPPQLEPLRPNAAKHAFLARFAALSDAAQAYRQTLDAATAGGDAEPADRRPRARRQGDRLAVA